MAKRKTAPDVKGDWDNLPHGLGKRVRLDKAVTNDDAMIKDAAAALNGNVNSAVQDDDVKDGASENDVETKDTPAPAPENLNSVQDVKDKDFEEKPKRRSPRNKANSASLISPENNPAPATENVNSVQGDLGDDDFTEEKPKKRQTLRKKVVIISSHSPKKQPPSEKFSASPDGRVLGSPSEESKKEERKKKHKYGLTPGATPFPNHTMPTPGACEEVNEILSGEHGVVTPPKVIPPPSLEVTGCGEVPDLLDALLRTLLSAATSGRNSALALDGLKKRFGERKSGRFAGSINWEAVYATDVKAIINSIRSGGLAVTKGNNIKRILDIVYNRNKEHRDALLKEKETGRLAQVLGAEHETSEQKDEEIALFNETLLNLDYISKLEIDEAMEELIKLPGIGVKTASCVILFRMQIPSFAVDTHVHRICNWLGWVPANTSRDKTFSHCEVRVPDHLKYSLHQLFIQHGKKCYRCKAATSAGTKEWNDTICPIEHLLNRTEPKKQPGYKPPPKGEKGEKGKNGKKAGDEIKESGVEMSNEE